ncbi:hypothetical protein K2Z83_20980 [Oscillochloris sp. ZM17-4]|uniref:hypothetical protein n=1 Tax=Oscillochloris sp. ZM17-4 TaxID=2866714 RepID=UPI001C730002|nr:hypothetical protein [Oscillochloris sp. ZM17-4]MBX0330146.1 hypothetical protein [Oscillochloris sp. ZM17-4]
MASPLEYEHWLPLLGLPLAVRTNSRALSEALDRELPLGDWAHLPTELIESVPTLQIDVLLAEATGQIGDLRLFRHGPTALAGDGSRLLLSQADRGYGLACLPPDALGDAITAIWELGALLARAHGRTPVRSAALAHAGRAALLIGEGCGPLLDACVGRGMRLLSRGVVHVSDGAGGLQIWGDGAGGDLLRCAGPATVLLVGRGAGRASQIAPLPVVALDVLGDLTGLVRAAYRLQAGDDLGMAAALVAHVA